MDLKDFRRQYQLAGLHRDDLLLDPIQQFETWLQQLLETDTPDPTAMVLSTVDDNNRPTQRIVLLKQVDEQGFTFFTNRQSNKGKQLESKPYASLHFPWHFIERQVIVEGQVERLSSKEDAAYFSSRPKESQWAAWASEQSQEILSKQVLIDRYESVKVQYGNDVPQPKHWGGYRVIPQKIEFWQGGNHRLHDRFEYRRSEDRWTIHRLSP